METKTTPLKGGTSEMKRSIQAIAFSSMLAVPFIGLFALEEISFRNLYRRVSENIYQHKRNLQLEYIHNRTIGIDVDADGIIDRQIPGFNPLINRVPRVLLTADHLMWDKNMQFNYSKEYGRIQRK